MIRNSVLSAKHQHVHVVAYSDETLIKHPYRNIDDVAIAFNQ